MLDYNMAALELDSHFEYKSLTSPNLCRALSSSFIYELRLHHTPSLPPSPPLIITIISTFSHDFIHITPIINYTTSPSTSSLTTFISSTTFCRWWKQHIIFSLPIHAQQFPLYAPQWCLWQNSCRHILIIEPSSPIYLRFSLAISTFYSHSWRRRQSSHISRRRWSCRTGRILDHKLPIIHRRWLIATMILHTRTSKSNPCTHTRMHILTRIMQWSISLPSCVRINSIVATWCSCCTTPKRINSYHAVVKLSETPWSYSLMTFTVVKIVFFGLT